MMNSLFWLFGKIILVYALALALTYLAMALASILEIIRYKRRNYFIDYKDILASPFAPGISLIAPAYNEGLTIIDNVKSLLSIMYNNYEVVIVNDGSKDNSLARLIESFNLVKVDYDLQSAIPTKMVKGIYKSRNRALRKLTVVDKANGGKADALNVGVNFSRKELVACIDVDCIIEPDALLKMVKPFMQNKEVIASGGVIRVGNSCHVEEGRLMKIKLPQRLLPRMQVLEYIRAFLLGRMAWSRWNGLLLISGALGLFNRRIAVKAGGYNTRTVGEDMELVVRMRRYMQEKKIPYRIAYIPDPLCWTEVPSSYAVLGRQRNRWARGTFETLFNHRKLLLNPKYGRMGMLSLPYWFLFEWLSPFVEFLGMLFFLFLAAAGKVNWSFFISLLLVAYAFSFFLSMLALVAEEISFSKYTLKRETFQMIMIALLEPILFHPRIVWWSLKGNFDLLKGKKAWGEMTRVGFAQSNQRTKTI